MYGRKGHLFTFQDKYEAEPAAKTVLCWLKKPSGANKRQGGYQKRRRLH